MSDEWEPTQDQRKFCAALAKMVAPMDAVEAVNALIGLLPALKHLPDWMFERPGDLAADIAADMERVPTLARLKKALEAWRDTHKPKMPALPGSDGLDLTPADELMIRFWNETRAGIRPLARGVTLQTSLDVMRLTHEHAFNYVIRTDLEAASIAVKAGWAREPQPATRTPEEIAHAERVAREAIQALHAAALPPSARDVPGQERKPTPEQHATMAADEGVVRVPGQRAPLADATFAERFEAEHGRKLGALTPEQQDKLREAAGIKFPAKPPPNTPPHGPRAPANDVHPDPTPPSSGPFPWSIGGDQS